MPLLLQEGLTIKLLESLRLGDIDVAILAEPFPNQGFVTQAVYDEPFVVAVPNQHPWARRKHVKSAELKEETMLLLGTGHCFRDQVLEVCPELSRYSQASAGIQKTFEGSSLETIRHMVASGIGITVLPWTAMPAERARGQPDGAGNGQRAGTACAGRLPPTRRRQAIRHSDGLLTYVPFHPVAPTRRVVLAWRKSFTRTATIAVLRQAILGLEQSGVTILPDEKPASH